MEISLIIKKIRMNLEDFLFYKSTSNKIHSSFSEFTRSRMNLGVFFIFGPEESMKNGSCAGRSKMTSLQEMLSL